MTELLARLRPWYDETPAARVMSPAGQAGWPGGTSTFGDPMADVRSIVVHLTAGWPRRNSANTFVARYISGQAPAGVGTQFYIAQDGTVARLIDIPRRTGHATYVNAWALGVETGNLGNVASPPGATDAAGRPHWLPASGDAEDMPGAKLWFTGRTAAQNEVMAAWWTTATYAGPGRGVVGADRMIFSEWQYRAWALLLRHLTVDQGLPRNFPLLPHTVAARIITDSVPMRRNVLADERADMMTRAFQRPPINIQAVNFQPANAAALQTEYSAAVHAANATFKRHNRAWREYFNHYRGVHGHGYAGAIHRNIDDKTECPGRLFDFHRLAREVWDWWWQPFDVGFRADLDRESTAVPRRGYRRFTADTPLLEYYFDEDNATRAVRRTVGIHGNASSPATFRLDAASPVYAMAGGELVAARFPEPGPGPHTGVDLAFALVRHEIYHQRLFPSVIHGPFGPVPVPLPPLIHYGRAPSTVYSLYMHLGRPERMSFEEVSDGNPDWLNRLLVRKRECDLGVSFHDDHPTHHGIAAAVWNNRPPGVPRRPTTLEAWRADQAALTVFMDNLSAGNVALAPRAAWTQPVKVLLGDFLGESGVIRNDAGTVTHGVRVETFSPSLQAPTFQLHTGLTGWSPPGPALDPPCVPYPSEWARGPSSAELAELAAIGVDTDLLGWWGVVVLFQSLDTTLPAGARLPLLGDVFHYDPLDFARWINGVTWASEWPKYEVTDATGNPVALPARPRTRRI